MTLTITNQIAAVLNSDRPDTEIAEILTGLGIRVPDRVCRMHYWLVEDVARIRARLGLGQWVNGKATATD